MSKLTLLLFLCSAMAQHSAKAEDRCERIARVHNSDPIHLPYTTEIFRCGSDADLDLIVGLAPRVSRHLESAEKKRFLRSFGIVQEKAQTLKTSLQTQRCNHALQIEVKKLHLSACPGTEAFQIGQRIFGIARELRDSP